MGVSCYEKERKTQKEKIEPDPKKIELDSKKIELDSKTIELDSKKIELDSKKNKYICKFTKEELRNKLTAFFGNAKIIKDESSNKNNDNIDLTFIQLKR